MVLRGFESISSTDGEARCNVVTFEEKAREIVELWKSRSGRDAKGAWFDHPWDFYVKGIADEEWLRNKGAPGTDAGATYASADGYAVRYGSWACTVRGGKMVNCSAIVTRGKGFLPSPEMQNINDELLRVVKLIADK